MLLPSFLWSQLKLNSFIEIPGSSYRQHALHFTKLSLELSFEPTKGLVKGKVNHYFTPLLPRVDSFFLDGIKMDIKEIKLNGQAVKYHTDSTGILIYAASPLLLE